MILSGVLSTPTLVSSLSHSPKRSGGGESGCTPNFYIDVDQTDFCMIDPSYHGYSLCTKPNALKSYFFLTNMVSPLSDMAVKFNLWAGQPLFAMSHAWPVHPDPFWGSGLGQNYSHFMVSFPSRPPLPSHSGEKT